MKFALFLAAALSAFALDFPMSLAVAPDGRVLVLNGGAKASDQRGEWRRDFRCPTPGSA